MVWVPIPELVVVLIGFVFLGIFVEYDVPQSINVDAGGMVYFLLIERGLGAEPPDECSAWTSDGVCVTGSKEEENEKKISERT